MKFIRSKFLCQALSLGLLCGCQSTTAQHITLQGNRRAGLLSTLSWGCATLAVISHQCADAAVANLTWHIVGDYGNGTNFSATAPEETINFTALSARLALTSADIANNVTMCDHDKDDYGPHLVDWPTLMMAIGGFSLTMGFLGVAGEEYLRRAYNSMRLQRLHKAVEDASHDSKVA